MKAPRLKRSAVAVSVALCSLLTMTATTPASAATDPNSADYKNGYSLGQQAYEYGRPLLDTERLFRTQTSVRGTDLFGDGSVNRFHHIYHPMLPTNSQQNVVAPNDDTLYSLGWLDLSAQPQIVHVPAIAGRFFVLEMLSPWTEDFYNLSSSSGPRSTGAYNLTRGGNFLVVPPGYRGAVPRGLRVVHSPYKRVWVLGRTFFKNTADIPTVNAIQNKYTITPLSRWGRPAMPLSRPSSQPATYYKIPGTQPGQDPLSFYTALGHELTKFGPMAGDGPLLAKLRQIGVGVGLNPATNRNLSANTLAGMRAAVTDGEANLTAELKQIYTQSALSHNGYLVLRTGTYGTNYQMRAIVDKVGLGANLTNVAIYPLAQTDRLLQTLTGANKYVIHIPAGGMPPVQGFWSLTMYDIGGFFVKNPLDRYALGTRTPFHKNADGSVDIYIQATAPTNAAQRQNWLPAPAGAFRLMWRLYAPGSAEQGILDGTGWQVPSVQRCVGGIGLPGLTACAS